MNCYFDGYYLKHQQGGNTVCFIVGSSSEEEFIQVITNSASYHTARIGGSSFTPHGIQVDIHEPGWSVTGKISYGTLTPIRYDIMGIFKHFKMECRHDVISMYHKLEGSLTINGELLDFSGGIGYIERDSGTSFPKSYLWAHCNNFPQECSVMAAVAHIPFYGVQFKGCICVVNYLGKEYRLATYLGVRIVRCSPSQLILKQGSHLLQIDVTGDAGHKLYAPTQGKMSRTIHESPSCEARFRFYKRGELLFDYTGSTSFEFVEQQMPGG